MARVVSRCCGGAWISRIRTPSNGRAAPGRKGRLGVLSAVCALVLAAPVATARAEDPPQLPVPPTVPTIAVQVSVSIPSVSVSVQVGTVGSLRVDRTRRGLGLGADSGQGPARRSGRRGTAAAAEGRPRPLLRR